MIHSTLYHYQFCGYGDSIPPPGACVGPLDTGALASPGQQPAYGDLSATSNFRTAGPETKGTIDLGRVTSVAESAENPIVRDGGISVQYSSNPPQALWIFGDSVRYNGNTPEF